MVRVMDREEGVVDGLTGVFEDQGRLSRNEGVGAEERGRRAG